MANMQRGRALPVGKGQAPLGDGYSKKSATGGKNAHATQPVTKGKKFGAAPDGRGTPVEMPKRAAPSQPVTHGNR